MKKILNRRILRQEGYVSAIKIMIYKKFTFRFYLLFIILFLNSFQLIEAQTRTKLVDKPVYMHYMPWFDSPEYNSNWGGHWTMSNMDPNVIIDEITGKREIASHYYPLIGPYDSQDPDVIEYHILLMKYSGIDGILMNWYGKIGTNGDVGVLLENSNSIVNVSDELNMDFSVVMEDRFAGSENGLNLVDYVYINIEYLKENYFPKNNFIKTDLNEPFFGIFGPVKVTGESNWNYALTAAEEDVLFLPLYWDKHKVGQRAGGGYDWVIESGVSAINYFYQTIAPTLDFAMGCAYPGFKDFYEEGGWGSNFFYLDPNQGELLKQTIGLAETNKDVIDALQLVTWNDFGEGTIFEPTYEFGFQRLTILQNELGVPYSEYELQQIYRLYKFRKMYRDNPNAQTNLDNARNYFINNQVNEAISIMDNIEAEHSEKLFRIKSRLNGQYLYQDNNLVKYGDLESNDSFNWQLEIAGDGFYYIKNELSNDKINIENQTGLLECTSISLDSWSSMWEKRTIDGTHMRLVNKWIPNQYINIENESYNAEHSTSERSWLSGHWILEEVDNSLTVEKHHANGLTIFPNPSKGFVTINCLNHISNFMLYDLTGKILTTDNPIYSDNTITFSVKNLVRGVYFLKVQGDFEEKVIKLVIEN
ncbi:MAG: T9SS type A sorting domain-containing protein [Polaribacter sp.]|nr:T9SS type A sorting domain-containing protein [Polaribacter sp.]